MTNIRREVPKGMLWAILGGLLRRPQFRGACQEELLVAVRNSAQGRGECLKWSFRREWGGEHHSPHGKGVNGKDDGGRDIANGVFIHEGGRRYAMAKRACAA